MLWDVKYTLKIKQKFVKVTWLAHDKFNLVSNRTQIEIPVIKFLLNDNKILDS